MILYSADFGTRSEFSARSAISGPIPAQSPRVMPIRDLFLMLMIVIESYLIDYEHDYEQERDCIDFFPAN